jgi:predicted transcriptional regulator
LLQQTSEHVLISLRPNLIDAFLVGEKCVELRRRAPKLRAGTLVWLYAKLPYGRVMAVAKLRDVTVDTTESIWDTYRACIGISRTDFDAYVSDIPKAAILSFDAITPVSRPTDLKELREIEPGFQPPQFFRRMQSSKLLHRLTEGGALAPLPACQH